MTLTYIPAHSSYHPDRFIDEKTGLGYSVVQDTGAEDPRNSIEDGHAAVYIYRGPRGSSRPEAPENIAAQAFARYYETCDNQKSLALTQRYLAAYHPEEKISVGIQTIRGFSQSDWLDVFAAISDGYGTPESHIEEFRMWTFGDVWIVVPDGKAGISGIYAEDSEAALEFFRADYEDTETVASGNEETLLSQPLDPLHAGPFRVSWKIDSDEDISPVRAAANAWTKNFNRGAEQPSPDDACVFTVTDSKTGANLTIDLSDPEYAGLFA